MKNSSASVAVWLTAVGLWCGLCRGGEPVPVREAEIVSNAVAHSYVLRVAASETEAARAALQEARSGQGPSVDAALQASRYEGLVESALGPQIVIPAIETRYAGSVTVTQPLFTGGRVRAAVAAAGLNLEAAEALRKAQDANVVLDALATYWAWSKAHCAVASFEAAVARMEEHARTMRSQNDAGLVTENDTLATEVALDRTRLQCKEAQRRGDLARARLAFLTGRELPAEGTPELAAPAPPGELPDLPQLVGEAMTGRLERVAYRKTVEAADASVRRARAAFYPQAALIARYEQARPNNLFFPPEDTWDDDAFAGVALQWNLLDWGLSRSKTAEAAARREQARLRAEQADESIALQVREARISLQNAVDRSRLARKAEESAQRNVKVATDLWQNGLARHAEVLDAHARLTDAQSDSIAAAADAVLAQAALKHATGQAIAPDPR